MQKVWLPLRTGYSFFFYTRLQRMKRMPIYKWEITSSVKHGDGKTTSVGFDIWTVRMVMACTPFIEGLGSSIQMKTHAFCILCSLQLSKMQRMMGA